MTDALLPVVKLVLPAGAIGLARGSVVGRSKDIGGVIELDRVTVT